MPADAPQSPGRVPVAIYLASDSGDPDGKLADLCGKFADARDWLIVEVFVDTAPLPALSERDGWQRVAEALSRGSIQGVVTWTRAMVADTSEEWDRLAAILTDRGGFLVSGALNTPGQSLYGRTTGLASASTGTPRIVGRRTRSERPSSGNEA